MQKLSGIDSIENRGYYNRTINKTDKNLPHYLKTPLSVRSVVENALAIPGTFLKRMKYLASHSESFKSSYTSHVECSGCSSFLSRHLLRPHNFNIKAFH